MTTAYLQDLFERHNDDFQHFERVANPTSKRSDLHAFMLLDRLVPGVAGDCGDMVSSASHDEIYLTIEPKRLAAVINEEQVLELVRCGVRYDSRNGGLCMFV